jgi:outer membrane beta-barrel protein
VSRRGTTGSGIECDRFITDEINKMKCPIHILVCLLSLGIISNTFGDTGNKSEKKPLEKKPVKIIEPNKEVTTVQAAAIDTEHFEFGVYGGLLSAEDFNTNPVVGFSLTYHINSTFLAQLGYGSSRAGHTATEEKLLGNIVSDDGYNFKYVNLVGGYKLFDGRSFLGKNYKFNSAIYLLAGIAKVDFADTSNNGLVLGASYRVVITDWLTVNFDLRDTNVKRDLSNFDDSKQTNNTEMFFGVNALF